MTTNVKDSICIIPARGGSRRIPRKNIRPFHGRPIIEYAIDSAKAAEVFERIYISTEDAEISEIAKRNGAEVITRPRDLAQDHVGTQTVMMHACEALHLKGTEAVCCLYATTPLLNYADLRWAFYMKLLRMCSYVIAVSTEPLADAGAFYFGGANEFLKGFPLYMMQSAIYPLPAERCQDINTLEDWTKAETMYAALQQEAQ